MATQIWEYSKKYTPRRGVGAEITMVVINKPGALSVELIQEIICEMVLEGNCAFYRVKLPGKRSIIIDDVQYADLIAKANI